MNCPPGGSDSAARAISEGYSERVIAVRLNVTDPASVERLARDVDQQFGALHVLVNNAAVHYDTWQTATAADIEGVVREAFETNVLGAWRLIRAFVPLMPAQQTSLKDCGWTWSATRAG